MRGILSASIIVAVILFTGVMSNAWGADELRWKHYATSIGGQEYFYDLKSVVYVSNSNVKVWIIMVAPDSDSTTVKDKKLYEMDCSKRIYRLLAWVWELKKGNAKRIDKPTAWSDIEPETTDEMLLDIVCKKEKASKKK